MREFKLFLLYSLTMYLVIAITAFSIAYLGIAIKYLFNLVSTLSPINRTPAFILLCSVVPVTVISLLIASDGRSYK